MPKEMEFMVEDARLIFRNFSGQVSQFNPTGKRNFAVVLEDEIAVQMAEDGWNVKWLEPREDGDTATPYVSVEVNFDKGRPPRVVLITSGGRTQLDGKTIGVVDQFDIKTADLICRAYHWEVGDKSGVKAYLKTLMITVDEDALERKYKINEHPPTSPDQEE